MNKQNFIPNLENPWEIHSQQYVFRKLLRAFSFPGDSVEILKREKDVDLLRQLVLSTLIDAETTFSDPDNLLSKIEHIRLKPEIVSPEKARYIIACGTKAPSFTPFNGTLISPEFGATLILKAEEDIQKVNLRVNGPGINSFKVISLEGISKNWITERENWIDFPLGVDFIIYNSTSVIAFPRTTKIEILEG
jgi:alpha-D-ribose 1-methylphosphonate 5-triphosphate synthase subunit PhnH